MIRLIPAALLALTACSHMIYQGLSDGSTTAEVWEFGTNRLIDGLLFETTKEGDRKISVNALDTNRVDGLQEINQGLSLIVEGAIKGAK